MAPDAALVVIAVAVLVLSAPLMWVLLPRVRSWIGYPLSDEQRARVDAAIAEREQLADRVDREVPQGLGALSGLVPRPDLGRCSRRISEPGRAEGIGASVLPGDAPWPLTEATSLEALASARSQLAQGVDDDAAYMRRDRDDRFPSEGAIDRFLEWHPEIFSPSAYEVFFVRTAGPARDDALGDPSPVLAGTAYLYDNDEHRFVCAAEVSAQHGDEVEYVDYIGDESSTRSSIRSALAGDLRTQLYRAIARSLVPLGPPPSPPDEGPELAAEPQ